MGKASIRHLRRQVPDTAFDERDDGWLAQRTVYFFDLALLLPHQPASSGFERGMLMIENRLHRVVRRKDRIVWALSGFYLVIGTSNPDQALAVVERVKDYICAECVDPREAPPLSAMAVRLASPAELERFSLMSA